MISETKKANYLNEFVSKLILKNFSKNTIKTYKGIISHFLDWCPDKPP
jgi:site-specific recombinase XerD